MAHQVSSLGEKLRAMAQKSADRPPEDPPVLSDLAEGLVTRSRVAAAYGEWEYTSAPMHKEVAEGLAAELLETQGGLQVVAAPISATKPGGKHVVHIDWREGER